MKENKYKKAFRYLLDEFYQCPKHWESYQIIKEAIEISSKSLEKQDKHRWIPVSERLPKIDGSYLIQLNTRFSYCGFGIHKAMFSVDKEAWESIENCVLLDNVIAWMPLPEPYVEGKNE